MHRSSGSSTAPIQGPASPSASELALGSSVAAEALPAVTPPSPLRALAIVRKLLSLARPTDTKGRRFLGAFLVADLAFIGAFVLYAYAEHYGVRDSPFHGNVNFSFVDGSYPEIYGYAKEALLTLLFVTVYARTRQVVYLALALLFAICALDDSLALHEAAGRLLAGTTGLSRSAGEFAGWCLLGSVPMLALVPAYRRSDITSRYHAEAVLLGFAILLFFAIGMDVVHAVVQRYIRGFQTVLTIVEDGGELLTLTLLCMVSLAINRLAAESPPPERRSSHPPRSR